MNGRVAKRCLLAGLAAAGLSACVAMAPADHRAAQAREALNKLEADADVKTYAPDALARAEQAVNEAEGMQASADEAATLGYVALMRVQIAGYTAAAKRDNAAYQQLVARRDALRPGQHQDGLTTLALDALNASPQQFEFKPLGNSAPLPPPVEKPAVTPAANAPAAEVPQPQNVNASAGEPHPLLALGATAFAGGTALKPIACSELDKVVPVLIKHVQRPVLVYFGAINATEMERASAVRDYLVAHGVARQRLFIAATSDISMTPTGGVSVDFQ